jgi:hypothetical protein
MSDANTARMDVRRYARPTSLLPAARYQLIRRQGPLAKASRATLGAHIGDYFPSSVRA